MEKIEVSDSRMYSLLTLFDMHTQFFKKAIDGISPDDAHNRLGTKANHVAWLAGSLTEQRYDLARTLGLQHQQRGASFFENYQGIQDGAEYPPLAQFEEDWNTISPILRDALAKLTSVQNDNILDMGPMKMPQYDFISFTIYREANCIGQIALWRRLLGYPALKYD